MAMFGRHDEVEEVLTGARRDANGEGRRALRLLIESCKDAAGAVVQHFQDAIGVGHVSTLRRDGQSREAE